MLMPEMVVGRQRTVVAGVGDLGGSAGGRCLRTEARKKMTDVGVTVDGDGDEHRPSSTSASRRMVALLLGRRRWSTPSAAEKWTVDWFGLWTKMDEKWRILPMMPP